jgi:hypothetical protein
MFLAKAEVDELVDRTFAGQENYLTRLALG